MSDLADFLLARIAEDEATARDVWRAPHLGDCDVLADLGSRDDGCTCGYPAQALAECDARRRLVEAYGNAMAVCALHADRTEGTRYQRAAAEAAVLPAVLAVLAVPYADHPDYRPEWRP